MICGACAEPAYLGEAPDGDDDVKLCSLWRSSSNESDWVDRDVSFGSDMGQRDSGTARSAKRQTVTVTSAQANTWVYIMSALPIGSGTRPACTPAKTPCLQPPSIPAAPDHTRHMRAASNEALKWIASILMAPLFIQKNTRTTRLRANRPRETNVLKCHRRWRD